MSAQCRLNIVYRKTNASVTNIFLRARSPAPYDLFNISLPHTSFAFPETPPRTTASMKKTILLTITILAVFAGAAAGTLAMTKPSQEEHFDAINRTLVARFGPKAHLSLRDTRYPDAAGGTFWLEFRDEGLYTHVDAVFNGGSKHPISEGYLGKVHTTSHLFQYLEP